MPLPDFALAVKAAAPPGKVTVRKRRHAGDEGGGEAEAKRAAREASALDKRARQRALEWATRTFPKHAELAVGKGRLAAVETKTAKVQGGGKVKCVALSAILAMYGDAQ